MQADSTEPSRAKVLCVDDEPAVLEGLERLLMDDFDVVTNSQPEDALNVLDAEGPFDVVVSDMRMPRMDGAAFLAAARRRAPDTERILLTGQADMKDAIAAVNEGQILRFLCKPCKHGDLTRALEDAVRQRQLVLSERNLLEKTLRGAVRGLSDVLALSAPVVFRRSATIARYARHVIQKLGLEPAWSFEIAAMLCHIGCVALPPDVLERVASGRSLSIDDARLFATHPETGYKLLSNIPRLENVALMVRDQGVTNPPAELSKEAATGALLLRVLSSIEDAVRRGQSLAQARLAQARLAKAQDLAILEALTDYAAQEERGQTRSVLLAELRIGMVLADDVCTTTGMTVVPAGAEVTMALRERLQKFAGGVGIRQPLAIKLLT